MARVACIVTCSAAILCGTSLQTDPQGACECPSAFLGRCLEQWDTSSRGKRPGIGAMCPSRLLPITFKTFRVSQCGTADFFFFFLNMSGLKHFKTSAYCGLFLKLIPCIVTCEYKHQIHSPLSCRLESRLLRHGLPLLSHPGNDCMACPNLAVGILSS